MRVDRFRRGDLVFDVIDAGDAGGPVVVLLHGFPQFANSWSRIVEQLTANGYRCLAPDQRGYSAGARPRGRWAYRISELVRDVLALIDASGAEPVHLVGHDWGAAVAWSLAAAHPAKVASLTALSVPHPAAFIGKLATSRQFRASSYIYSFQLPYLPEHKLGRDDGRVFAGLLRAARQAPEQARRDAAAMVRTGTLGPALNWYRAMPFNNPLRVRGPVTTPTLFVWSDGDTAILRGTAEACARWVSGPYRFEVIPGVSHWILDAAPEEAARLILENIAAHPGAAAGREGTTS